jgi:hypothetical protein
MASEQSVSAIPFDPEQERNILTLGRVMIVAGFLTIANGVVGIVTSLVGVLLSAQSAEQAAGQALGSACCGAVLFILPLVIGVWLIQGGRAFQAVATSDIADQEHLTTGFTKLRNIFLTKSVMIIGLFVILCLGVLAAGGLAAVVAAVVAVFGYNTPPWS